MNGVKEKNYVVYFMSRDVIGYDRPTIRPGDKLSFGLMYIWNTRHESPLLR